MSRKPITRKRADILNNCVHAPVVRQHPARGMNDDLMAILVKIHDLVDHSGVGQSLLRPKANRLKNNPATDDVHDLSDAIADIGIVIQGPLVSRGRTGATSQIKRHNLTQDDVIDFDCIKNIAQLFKTFDGFGKIICVVWADDPADHIQRLQNKIGKDNSVTFQDDSRAVKAKSGLVSGNNKYRQFLSSVKGIKVIEDLGLKFAIKVRSDQYLDLKRLAQDLLQIAAVRRQFMLVPKISSGSSTDHLADFSIGGRAADLRSYFDRYLTLPQMYEHIHTDIFYQWAALAIGKSP